MTAKKVIVLAARASGGGEMMADAPANCERPRWVRFAPRCVRLPRRFRSRRGRGGFVLRISYHGFPTRASYSADTGWEPVIRLSIDQLLLLSQALRDRCTRRATTRADHVSCGVSGGRCHPAALRD